MKEALASRPRFELLSARSAPARRPTRSEPAARPTGLGLRRPASPSPTRPPSPASAPRPLDEGGLPPDGVVRDRELLTRVAGDDGDALAELFDRHSSALLALLERILGAAGEAEEVLQEVFLQVWRQAGRYRRDLATPRGWMTVLARSRAFDRRQSAVARRRREERTSRERGERVVVPLGSRRLEAAERRRQLLAALGELSPEQREAVHLAFFEGLSHSQIAARLDAPLGTVKSRVLLGMRKLKRALSAAGEAEVPTLRSGS